LMLDRYVLGSILRNRLKPFNKDEDQGYFPHRR
jgi:hypothetical protein